MTDDSPGTASIGAQSGNTSSEETDTGGVAVPEWVEPRDYQRDAVQAWVENRGKGIYHMATGTGKTVTALLTVAQAASHLEELVVVVAVPYQHLVDQWAEEVASFGVDPVRVYRSRRVWEERLERELLEVDAGARDVVVAVVTHRTLASRPFQRLLDRSSATGLLVADEVHHVGAPHLRTGLSDDVPLRLGLSATPQRWYDDEGSAVVERYFESVVYEYGLQQAIDNEALVPYYYVPHVVELTAEETEQYLALSERIAHLAGSAEDGLGVNAQDTSALEHALFERARLVGAAENKLAVLTDLLDDAEAVEHALVYCSEGTGGTDDGAAVRQVDAVVDRLEALDIDAARFTAEESQAEREQLLAAFQRGDHQVLAAIRCLDEGVDVPATRTAFVLASSSNPRQFVQRRGRVLRPAPGKECATIHDFVAVPAATGLRSVSASTFSTERSMVRKELQRVSTFADAARNHPDTPPPNAASSGRSLRELKRLYNLRTV